MAANKLNIPFSKVQIATALALLFHVIGFIGLVWIDQQRFAALTPLNLLLMFGLILYTQTELEKGFLIFLFTCGIVGFMAEYVGVHKAWLFGHYQYGSALGWSFHNIPLIIGVNWFITIYGAAVLMHLLLNQLPLFSDVSNTLKKGSLVVDGAIIAVVFDWIMEPVAIRLGYWTWAGDGSIPFYNYVCWFFLSLILLLVFRFLSFKKENRFALHLLLIQTMFFLLLRTFL
jgi:putative membrane protein